MKNIYLIACLLTNHGLYAQTEILNANQVRADVNANGLLFNDPNFNRGRYEVPNMNGMGPNVIFGSTFWFGAVDQNSEIHVSYSGFSSTTTMSVGPIATNYSSQTYLDKYDHVYTVSASEIQTHQQNWNDPNYIMPDDILNWPGNGDLANGEAAILASFVDYNANNIYEPSLGDHPVIRGDKATFFILNDLAEMRDSTDAFALGMEFHVMVYQFITAGFLDSTTFINVKAINRSQNVYDQLISAKFTDFDIGGALDDYVGCSSSKNMMFGYNGDLLDDGSSGGAPLFGLNPPACGVKLLSHQMGASAYFFNFFNIDFHSIIWNNMNGNWGDGSSFTIGGFGVGGTVPTNFVYDGNPNDTTLWTEVSQGNNSNDRTAFMASEPIDNFAPGQYVCYDYAVLFSRTGGNNLLNVNGLFDVADSAQAFYDAQSYFYCEPLLLGESEIDAETNDFTIYPNPAHKEFRITVDGNFDITIYDIAGKVINIINGVNQFQSILAPINSGIYLIEITQNGITRTKKLIVE